MNVIRAISIHIAFIVYDNGGSATIYYDDIEILTVYNQDAYAGGFGSAGSYAAACTELLRQWVPVANANDTAVQSKSKDKRITENLLPLLD